MSQLSSPPSLRRLVRVVQSNPGYRRLLAANAISQMGDWLDFVALCSLLIGLTGRGESIAFVLVGRFLPMLLLAPIAGVVADRTSRRAMMVTADLLRAGLVLCLLLIRRPDQAWIAYAVIALHSSASAFFGPAIEATIPNLVPPEDLVVASAIDNSLWSTTLAFGSALGGVVMAHFGREAAFACDAASFLASAALIRGLPERAARLRREASSPAPGGMLQSGPLARRAHALGLGDFREGARYLAGHAQVRALIVVKGCFGLTLGGVLVLLPFFGERIFDRSGGEGIAVLFTARGIGSFLGPFVAWRLGGDSPPALRRAIGAAFALLCLAYLAFSRAPTLAWAALALAIANAGGSTLWTYGSALQQILVPDAFRGRVSSTDMASMTLALTVSTLTVGRALDAGVDPRMLMACCGLVALGPIGYWSLAQRHFRGASGEAQASPVLE